MKMKLSEQLRRVLFLLTALLAWAGVYACGSDDLSAGGGIGGTGVTIGEVSDYGSIFVNGVEFDTSQADILVEEEFVGNGDPAVHTNLPIGQYVVVQGEIDGWNGIALQVQAFYRVLGPLEDKVPLNDGIWRLMVMGQTVFVTPQTMLSGLSLQDIEPEMVIEVSGPVDAEGAVHAGFIAVVAPTPGGMTVGVKGPVQALNQELETFRINDLTIDYSRVDFPGAIAEGALVTVAGILSADGLIAAEADSFSTESFESVEDFIIEGFISGAEDDLFSVGGYRLALGSGTEYDGLPGQHIAEGMRVRVRGRLRNQVIEARWVSIVSRVGPQ